MRSLSKLILTLCLAAPLALGACSGDVEGDGGSSSGGASSGGSDDIIFAIDTNAGSSSSSGGTDTDTATATDAGTSPDVGTDLGTPQDTGNDCPGGAGCPCDNNDECDTAICLSHAGDKRCAAKCSETCPKGMKCVPYSIGGGDSTNVCAPMQDWLCNPCTDSKECQHVGLGDAVCVDYGLENGSFCGIPCSDKDSCPVGYSCKAVTSVEGAAAKQCVRLGAGEDFGACSCNPTAQAKKLSTVCAVVAKDAGGAIVSKCPGKRTCDDNGLSKCIGPAPGSEACDGVDNDCDGKTDENACDDNNQCTVDACKAAKKECVNAQVDGPCDADGNACTQADKCTDGVCLPGKAKSCDDGNPCTLDLCDKVTGKCAKADDDGKACDADGNICTQGDSCKAGKCVAGKAKNCDAGKPCVKASCDPVKGSCVFANQNKGEACDDGNPCTQSDTCDGTGGCAGPATDCDDGNICTTDTCDPAKGCASASDPNKAVQCYDGPKGTEGIGACKAGKRLCMADGSFGPCQAQVVPNKAETCDGKDDDCDGKTDEGCGSGAIVMRVSGGSLNAAAGKYRMRAIVGAPTAGRVAAPVGGKHAADWGIYAWLRRTIGK